jgi:hypothetical protein
VRYSGPSESKIIKVGYFVYKLETACFVLVNTSFPLHLNYGIVDIWYCDVTYIQSNVGELKVRHIVR